MLAPNIDQTRQQLTAILNVRHGLQLWINALENTVIPPLTPTPAWYTAVNTSLANTQHASRSFNSGTGPDIKEVLPNTFVEFSTFFGLLARDLAPLLDQIQKGGDIPDSAQVKTLQALVGAMRKRAAEHQTTVVSIQKSLAGFHRGIVTERTALKKALAAAVPAEQKAADAVEKVQLLINALEARLIALTTKANDTDVSEEKALYGLAIGVAMALGNFSLGGFGLGLLTVGIGFAQAEILNAEVEADVRQIGELMGTLIKDQEQFAMVEGVVSNLEGLMSGNEDAERNFSSFLDIWEFMLVRLDYLLVVLAQPKVNISLIPDFVALDQAVDVWQQISAFASKVQNASLIHQEPITITVNIPQSATATTA
ncbi:MAG: hypothetical protein ABI318_17160 [Chthoniobacteraceae bacterium]